MHAPTRPTLSPIQRLVLLLEPHHQDLGVVIVYAIGIGVVALATPIAVQALVNTVAFGALLQPVVVLSLLLLGVLVFGATLRGLQVWVIEILQRRLFVRIVVDLAHRLPRASMRAFDQQHGPELVNRFFDVFLLQKAIASLLLSGVEVVLTALVGMVVLAFYHPLLLGLDVLLVIAVAVIVFVLGRDATGTSIKESKAKYSVAAALEEIVRHPTAFKTGGGEAHAISRADELTRGYLNARKKHFSVVMRQIIGSLTLQAVASAALLGIGGYLVLERQLTLGQLVAAELIVASVVGALAKMGTYLDSFYDAIAAVDKLGQLLDLDLERDDGEAMPPRSGPSAVRAQRLRFGYAGRELFADAALTIEAGERVALAGPSGGGKSALVDLLFGLRQPTGGHVSVDSLDLREVEPESLRERVALVRRAELVDGTIVDNVRLGRDIPIRAVWTAIEAVGLRDELALLPDGLRTVVGPSGAPLSTSQAMRLTLARAIVSPPGLLILDEALDVVHGAARARVLDTLLDPGAPWTLLVVTDDERIFERCDVVYTLDGGRLSRIGGTSMVAA